MLGRTYVFAQSYGRGSPTQSYGLGSPAQSPVLGGQTPIGRADPALTVGAYHRANT